MKEKLKDIIYEEQKVNPSAIETLLENNPIEKDTAKEIIDKFEGKIDYPSGIMFYPQSFAQGKVSPYKRTVYYRIFQVYDKELGLFPDENYKLILNLMHSFNVNKRYYVREKVLKGKATWEDFNKQLQKWYKEYRKKVEKIVDNAGWPTEHAKLIVPLLYNVKDPEFPLQRTEVEGEIKKLFITK
jgi:hypothetical protein